MQVADSRGRKGAHGPKGVAEETTGAADIPRGGGVRIRTAANTILVFSLVSNSNHIFVISSNQWSCPDWILWIRPYKNILLSLVQ